MFLWLTSTKYMFSFMIICIYTWRHEITRKVAYVNETCDKKQKLQMFQSKVSIVNACLWMHDDHAHVMQVKLCKANTRGVTLMEFYEMNKWSHTSSEWRTISFIIANIVSNIVWEDGFVVLCSGLIYHYDGCKIILV